MTKFSMFRQNAIRWEMKEAFDNFFDKARVYFKVRCDDKFNVEIQFMMDLIWNEQITKPSQFYVND